MGIQREREPLISCVWGADNLVTDIFIMLVKGWLVREGENGGQQSH